MIARVSRKYLHAVAVPLLALATVVEVRAQQPVPGDTIPRDTIPADTIPTPGVVPGNTLPAITPDTIAVAPVPQPSPDDSLGVEVVPELSASADSVLQVLRSLPGFVATEYQGRSAVYRTETGILRLEGDAQVARAGDELTADTIEYNERTELVTASGGARVVSPGQEPIDSEILFYDLVRRRATALGARTQIQQSGAAYIVTGDVTLEEDGNRLFATRAHFTSCDLAIPHYHFETDQVMVIRDRILVARPARLYFGDVPVMVLPFVVQSLEQGRRSGFLTPRFGLNDIVRNSSGYTRQLSDVGFYWAISDYMGAQVSTTWRSGAYTSLTGNLQYNWRRQFLNGNFGLERIWEQDGQRQISLNTQSSWLPDERTNLSLSGRYASSSRFVRDATYDPLEQTQDLTSNLAVGRTFGWGRASFGAERRQSIATGDVSMTLPRFSLSPSAITLFSAPPTDERWFSNASFAPGVISGSRRTGRFEDNGGPPRQDRNDTEFRLGPSFSIGRFSLNASGDLNRNELLEAAGETSAGETITLSAFSKDEANWTASASYRQPLIGTSNLAPNISLRQQLVRDTLTSGEFLAAPMRISFGSSLNNDLYGFFPGVGPYSAVRHRLSTRLSYSYAPQVQQTALQDSVFGRAGGRAQNRLSLSLSQSFEAKLHTPAPVEEPRLAADSVAGDTVPQAQLPSTPSDPQKVTILSLTTSPFEYDFVKAREEGNGFVTERVSNTITSDYLRGLSIQMDHELFDKRQLDPQDPANAGQLGRFAPRLSTLSTGFQLGPQSSLIRWIDRLTFGSDRPEGGQQTGVLLGPPEGGEPAPAGQGAFTGNPLGTGGGPWNLNLSYQFSRPPRLFTAGTPRSDEAVQTLNGNLGFQLTPNWGVSWGTTYSITDSEFGAHRLNFQRDLHEWQANFAFFQAPNGNTAFEFYVELTHNRDLRLDYGERNLGIDRGRR